MTQLSPGSTFGAYLVEEVIGQGGMGVVYRARQVALDRVAALKVLAPELADDDEFRARFQRESRLLASIDHANVIPIYEAGELDGTLFLSMRYVSGLDMRELLRLENRLEPIRAVDLLDQVAAALDAAHAQGLVHRDVKPGNILIERRDSREHVFLSDFGLTKRATDSIGELTRTGEFVGTVDYVAPEQVRNEPVDARADVYALGCVLYVALTGEPPFPRDAEYAKVFAHVNDPPPSLADIDPGLPPALDAAVQRALAKDRDDRFPSAGDLARAARAAVLGGKVAEPERSVARGSAAPAIGTPTPVPGSTTKWPAPKAARGRPRWVIPAAVAVLAIVAVAAVMALAGGDGEDGGVSDAESGGPVELGAPEELPALGGRPAAIGTDGAYVYVTTSTGVARFDPADPTAPVRAGLGGIPGPVAAGEEGTWVLSSLGAFRLDDELARTGRLADVGRRSSAIAVGEGSLWATSEESGGRIYRLDPDSGRRTGTVELPGPPRGIAVGEGAVWVTVGADRAVRIDPEALEVTADVEVTGYPGPLAIGAEKVWIGLTDDEFVVAIDAVSAEQTGNPVRTSSSPASLTVGGETVWTANAGDGTITRIDASTGELLSDPIQLGGRPIGVAYAGDALWVIDASRERVFRLAAE